MESKPSSLEILLNQAFGLGPDLEIGYLQAGKPLEAGAFLGFETWLLGTELSKCLFPALQAGRWAAKNRQGQVFLIDIWEEAWPEGFPQSRTGPSFPSLPGQALVEAYLGWDSPSGLRGACLESLVSLYAVQVIAGLDARLLALPGYLPGAPIRAWPPCRLEALFGGLDLLEHIRVLCPPENASRGRPYPRAFASSWSRVLG